MSAMRDAALQYAAMGWHVHPLRPRDKVPLTVNGVKDATDDLERAAALFHRPDCNVGVATGPSGLLVVDLDGSDGMAALGRFTETRTAITGHGRHLYYGTEPDSLPSTVRRLGPGIDTRGRGGYTVAPPSVHPSGIAYRWLDPDAPVAPVPGWVHWRLRPRPKQRVVKRRMGSEGQQIQIAASLEWLRAAKEGERNHRLNAAAWHCRGALPNEDLAVLFAGEGEALGLGGQEVVATVASALGVERNEVEAWLQ
jgi:hypothetical protein